MRQDYRMKIRAALAEETGHTIIKPGGRCRVALVYPNSYFVGMSNLGFHIVYELWNNRRDTVCERFFLPPRADFPLLSMETQDELFRFDIVAFALSFEPDYFNVVAMLKRGGIEPVAKKRRADDPLVIVGGPCATFNPEPLADFADAFIVGEGEVILPVFTDAFLAARGDGAGKEELLERLAAVPGVYVPSLYTPLYNRDGTIDRIENTAGAPVKVRRQWVQNLDDYPAHTVIVTDNTELNMYLVEAARGCGRHCRFCMAGYCFRRPRVRSPQVLLDTIDAAARYNKRIGLMGAALSDYPHIDDICREILSRGMKMSVASFRADSVTKTLVDALAAGGLRTLTVAPEAGSAKMRRIINKGIEEADVFRTVDLGLSAGIRNFRFYFMVALPFEDDADIFAIADMTKKVLAYAPKIGKLTLSVNPFVPKPFTPFERVGAAAKKYADGAVKQLRGALKGEKKCELIFESPKSAYWQSVLARGDRRLAPAIALAAERGGAKALAGAMREYNLAPEFYAERERHADEILPWHVLDMGVRDEYFAVELGRAKQQTATLPCREGCRRCGVCE